MPRNRTSRRLYGRRRARLPACVEEAEETDQPILSVEESASATTATATVGQTGDGELFDDIPIPLEENEFNPEFSLDDATKNDLDALVDQIELHDDRITWWRCVCVLSANGVKFFT